MIVCCRHPAQSTSSALPAPALPLCDREILVLAVNECPDFIALDAGGHARADPIACRKAQLRSFKSFKTVCFPLQSCGGSIECSRLEQLEHGDLGSSNS